MVVYSLDAKFVFIMGVQAHSTPLPGQARQRSFGQLYSRVVLFHVLTGVQMM